MTMAATLGVMGAADVMGTIASGWICDRFGARGPLAFLLLVPGLFHSCCCPSSTPRGHAGLRGALRLELDLHGTADRSTLLRIASAGRTWAPSSAGSSSAHQVGAAIAAYGAGSCTCGSGTTRFPSSLRAA